MAWNELGGKVLSFYKDRYQNMIGGPKPSEYPPLDEMFPRLIQFSDEVYGLYGLKRDLLYGKVGTEERIALICRCIEEGNQCAGEVMDRFGNILPSQIAAAAGISIQRPFMPAGGGRVLFAEFEEPAEIRVYQSAIEKAGKAMETYHLEPYFCNISIEEILIAHELFHWLEMERKDSIFTRNYQINLWQLGPYRHRSRLASLSEITAMSFAKRLTGLPFSPYMLDVFLSYAYQPDIGGALYYEVCQAAAQLGVALDEPKK